MSHYKSESGGNHPKALCRFVKILPTGPHVTFGSGCIVLQSVPPLSADLMTTIQVLTKNDLLGDSSIFVQFEDNPWCELKLKAKMQSIFQIPNPEECWGTSKVTKIKCPSYAFL